VLAVLDTTIGEAVPGVSNDALLACMATLAGMSAAYILCAIRARKTQAVFSLGRLEKVELDRAVLLYKKVGDRLGQIHRQANHAKGNPLARYNHCKQVRRKFAEELADLKAYAAHLRSTIVGLRRRPLQRYKRWLRLHSSRFALSRSLAACVLVVAMLTAWSFVFAQGGLLGQQVLNEEMEAVLASFLEWQPARDPMLYAHSIGAGFLPFVIFLLYLYRWVQLHGKHRQQFRALKELAVADPDRLIPPAPVDSAMSEGPAEAPVQTADERDWSRVLGLSPAATIDEVKQAYKLHIKANHPDRVHDMSPMFRELAEAETKKLNAAYEEALLSLQHV
jgi:hypothetical protein